MGKRMSILVFALCAALATSQHMVVLPAGPLAAPKPEVKTLDALENICPDDFKNGFAIECRNGMVPPVSFFVDGELVRKTNKWPYTLAEFKNGARMPYTGHANDSKQIIECRSAWDGPKQTVEMSYLCTEDLFEGATVIISEAKEGITIALPSASPSPSPSFTNKFRWVGDRGCVVINGSSPDGPLTAGWTHEEGGGLTWRKNDNWGGIVRKGTSPLNFKFQVPKNSTYGITLDMTTRHWTEHNDVFLRFHYGDGLAIRRPGSFKDGGTWYHKAYHNKNRRAIDAKAIDHYAHSFSTMNVLETGKTYFITIGARSTKVTLHNIILFPCSGKQCNHFNPYWSSTIETCVEPSE